MCEMCKSYPQMKVLPFDLKYYPNLATAESCESVFYYFFGCIFYDKTCHQMDAGAEFIS